MDAADKKKSRKKQMAEVLTIVLIVVGWLLLTQVVLPKLGVPT
jgi:hypothetical protein